MTRRAIVLDANILIRAVLGQRVRDLIMAHTTDVSFFAPDDAFGEARQYLPGLLEKRGVSGAAALATLDALEAVVQPIDAELYQPLQEAALSRIGERDFDDWPVLAWFHIACLPQRLRAPRSERAFLWAHLVGRAVAAGADAD